MTSVQRHRQPGFRRLAPLICAVAFLASFVAASAQSLDDLDISSKRYIVIDAQTGEIIAEQNADEQAPIASLTKVFTTIEALERGDLDQLITTKPEDVYDASSTLMGFGPGETFTLRDLLYGMMLPSGNDAAHAIARSLGATEGASDQEGYDHFIELMNERAINMGLQNTHFMNPHGWGVEGHYSSARDIATFVMYALNYPEFRELIGTSYYTTADGGYTVSNTNRLLLEGYSGLIGGKTGYDDDAGYCLIEVAQRGDTTLISVTLDGTAPDIWYQDNVILLEAAFSSEQQRQSEGLPIQGEVLAYRDPDAAQILASSQSGGSVGGGSAGMDQAQSPALASQAGSDSTSGQGESSSTAIDADSGNSESSGPDARSATTGVIAVAGLIAAVIAFKALSGRRAASPDQPAN